MRDAQADTAPTGGYITWLDGRVSASYCQMVAMLSTWGHRGEGPVTYIVVCECSMVITALWDMRALVKEGGCFGCWTIQRACTH